MRKQIWLALLSLLLLALVAGCPRDRDGDDTTVVVDETQTPSSTVIEEPDAEDPAGNGDTEVNVDVDVTDEGAATDGEAGEQPDVNVTIETPPAEGETETPAEPAEDPATVTVVLETTKGDVVLAIHPEWAPLGAARFLELVRANYYDGAPWFRVIPGFMAQNGISPNQTLLERWSNNRIQDDPVVKSNARGTVSFGTSGANSRTTHFFVNYVDNGPMLDPQGFAAFAEVVEGMQYVEAFHPITDEAAMRAMGSLGGIQAVLPMPNGMEQFKAAFPDADYITRAYVR